MQDIQVQFDDWKKRAEAVDILNEARSRGAKLRKIGTEWVGPCPCCGGRDRFAINPSKKIFICRGAAGGDVIGLVMHISGVDFLGACEQLTREPPPRGKSKPLSDEDRSRLAKVRADNEAISEQRRRQDEAARIVRLETAGGIWSHVAPVANTPAAGYLIKRGIPEPPMGWPAVLGFARLPYPTDGAAIIMPCLVARVDDVAGELTAIWRIFLTEDGCKAKVENAKLGLGPAAGGAVRIGGLGPRVGVAEGLESGLAAWTILNYKHPVWPVLSTSGMIGFEAPLEIECAPIYPDGDLPRMLPNGDLAPDPTPPGLKAARALKVRLEGQGIRTSIGEAPLMRRDCLDFLSSAYTNLLSESDALVTFGGVSRGA